MYYNKRFHIMETGVQMSLHFGFAFIGKVIYRNFKDVPGRKQCEIEILPHS